MRRNDRVLRWSLLARFTHYLLLIGVVIGVLTGLPVLDGKLFYPLYIITGGEFGREFLHHYATLIILLIAVPFVILRGVESLTREGEESWWPGWEDIRKAFVIIGDWFGVTKKYPKIGFHHPMEKLLLISVHLGLILLGLSGIPIVLFDVGYEFRALLMFIHDIGFILVIIPIAGHFMLAINPVNWPTLKAMFINGYVPRSWALKHHSAWIGKKD